MRLTTVFDCFSFRVLTFIVAILGMSCQVYAVREAAVHIDLYPELSVPVMLMFIPVLASGVWLVSSIEEWTINVMHGKPYVVGSIFSDSIPPAIVRKGLLFNAVLCIPAMHLHDLGTSTPLLIQVLGLFLYASVIAFVMWTIVNNWVNQEFLREYGAKHKTKE